MEDKRIEKNWKRFQELAIATNRHGIEELLERLEETNIKETPASTRYHLADKGGLIEHSLNVYNTANKIWKSLDKPVPEDSLIIVALFHDLGKHQFYGKDFYKELPLTKTGQRRATPYERNKDLIGVPHEIISISELEKYIRLTEDEYWAILQHNGMYGDLKYQLQGKETKLQMIIHWADMWASRVIEKE